MAPHDDSAVGMVEVVEELTVGEYTLSVYDDESFWIAKDGGEGAQIRKSVLEVCLRAFFETNL